MKCLLPFLLVFTFCAPPMAQTSGSTQTSVTAQTPESTQTTTPPSAPSSQPEQRLFFPKGWYWGWGQFDLAPPHNEIDPNSVRGERRPIRRRQRQVQCVCAVT